jgi:hypothetical protein
MTGMASNLAEGQTCRMMPQMNVPCPASLPTEPSSGLTGAWCHSAPGRFPYIPSRYGPYVT